ncbi:mechanosensitive ion channel family protein, partial [Streptococcus dysgalactiae]|uniref:mechanosensitive ion channel family protein n=3 Tax=Bacteria TaxID=2 RepID=UPI001CA3164D
MLDAIAKDLKTVDPAALHTLRFDEQLFTRFGDAFSGLAVNLVIAVIILAVTFWAAGWISALVRRAIGRLHRAAPDPTLQNFAGSLARYLVIIVGLIAVLQQLGVQTTSIL